MEKSKETLKIAIIIGSKSDEDKIQTATRLLDKFSIQYSLNVCSAHRNPHDLNDIIREKNEDDSYKAFIAAAGMSAALPGYIAPKTTKPVIGLPLSNESNNVDDLTALLSMLEMPPGVPVMTVGINSGKNAALAALEIIALFDCEVHAALEKFKLEQAEKVRNDNKNLLGNYRNRLL